MIGDKAYQLDNLNRLSLRPFTHHRDDDAQVSSRVPAFITAKRVCSLLRHTVLRVYEVASEVEGIPLKAIVADDGSTLPYLLSAVFPNDSKVTPRGSIAAITAHKSLSDPADITIVGANVLLLHNYLKAGYLVVPKWIRLFLPIVGHPDLMLEHRNRATRKYFRRLIRNIEETGYTSEVTMDPEWFPAFYNDMYRPYALQRYGTLAVVHDYRHVRKRFMQGGGLIIKRQGEPVGAAILCPQGDTLWVPHMGVLSGDPTIARQGMTMAMDYFIVELAHSLGYSAINYGHARPFVTDGVLRYKLTWHMDVCEDDDALSTFAMKFDPASKAAAKLLAQAPFYHLDNGKVAFFTPPGVQSNGADMDADPMLT